EGRSCFEKWPSVAVEPVPHARVVSQKISDRRVVGIHESNSFVAPPRRRREFSKVVLRHSYSAATKLGRGAAAQVPDFFARRNFRARASLFSPRLAGSILFAAAGRRACCARRALP